MQPKENTARSAAGYAYFMLAIAAFSWGGNAVASRVAVGEVSPMVLNTLRWPLCVAVFFLITPRSHVGNWRDIIKHWPYGLAMGALGYTGFSSLLFIAGHYTSAVNLALLQSGIPVFVFIGAYLFFGTKLDAISLSGVAITLIGVATVASKGDLSVLLGLKFNFGDVLLVLGTALYAGYTLGLRKRPSVPAGGLYVLMVGGAFLAALPMLAGEIALGKAQWPTPTGWAILGFVGVFPSLIAQRCYMRGVEMIGPGRSGIFVNLVPIFGAFLSVVLLHEPFGTYHAIALSLVLIGILIAERRVLFGMKR